MPGSRPEFRAWPKWLLWSVLALPPLLGLGPVGPAAQASAPALDGGLVIGMLAAQQVQPNHYAAPVGGITLEQAADKVRRQTGGRVLSATPVEKGGRRGYNVRVLVDGKRVKQYYVDSDGRMSSR